MTAPRKPRATDMDCDGHTVRVFNGRSWVVVADLVDHRDVGRRVKVEKTAQERAAEVTEGER